MISTMRRMICREEIRSEVHAIHDLTHRILTIAEKHGFGDEALKDLHLALDESIANAFIHGNAGMPGKSIQVRCFLHDDDVLEIRVRDQGHGFNRDNLPDPTHGDNILNPHGRGIFLIKRFMDRVDFNRPGNEIRMWKRRT